MAKKVGLTNAMALAAFFSPAKVNEWLRFQFACSFEPITIKKRPF